MVAGFFKKLTGGLTRSRKQLGEKIQAAAAEHRTIDAAFLEAVEEILITADLGMAVTGKMMQIIDNEVRYTRLTDPTRMWEILRDGLIKTLNAAQHPLPLDHKPTVMLVVGVNGVGKTTTIGKLTARYRRDGKKVMLAAGDTFRAAASEQLGLWGEKLGVDVVRHQEGADSSAVAYDACEAALARNIDLLLIDTAGRLHTNVNLMEELTKVRRVIGKVIDGAPHQVLLVLDATTGQNALSQAETFSKQVAVTGLVLTKMDSTAKGGILVNLVEKLQVPVYFIGVGESADDLLPFDTEGYVSALFKAG